MKARDYAQRWVDSGKSLDSLGKIVSEMIFETRTIAKERGVQSDTALIAVIREVDEKWRAFARQFPGEVEPEGFRLSLTNTMPLVREIHDQIWSGKKLPPLVKATDLT